MEQDRVGPGEGRILKALRMTIEQFESVVKRFTREATARKDVGSTVSVRSDHRPISHLPGPTKYGNVKTDGEDSKRQAKRLFVLRLMNEAGQIRGLARQVEYVLIAGHRGHERKA